MNKLLKYCEKLLNFLNAGLVGMIFIITALQIFFRFILNSPLTWTEEVSIFCLYFVVFLGASIVEKENLHVRVEFIYNVASKKIVKYVEVLSRIFSSIIALMIIGGIINLFPRIVKLKSNAARIPFIYIYIIIIIGGIFWVIFAINSLMLVSSEEENRQ